MPLRTECPRCPAPLGVSGDDWACPDHGTSHVLRRPEVASYETFAELLAVTGSFPTFLPWPLSPGWSVVDFAVVGPAAPGSAEARATLTCAAGTSALDGPVDVFVISEESGTGLGARCAGTTYLDPGAEIGSGPPAVRVRVESQAVPLWPVSIAVAERELDRSVVAGEAHGRWLWIVLRPASAILLLRDEWILRDVSVIGPSLVEMPFGGPAPAW
jgi:hypothetical protein